MSKEKKKRDVERDHNYKNRSPMHEISDDIVKELQLLKKAYRRFKDKIADSVGLSVELQQEDLEDVRISKRVADRFKNLQCATDKNESIKATIDALKPLAYSHKPNHKISEYEINRFREEFGDDIADYEINYAKSDDKNSQDHKEDK